MQHTTVILLQSLIETNRARRDGYHAASTRIHNSAYTTTFYDFSLQSSNNINELRTMIHELGGQLRPLGKAKKDVQDVWDLLQSANLNDDELAVLDMCEQGESSAIEQYEHVLEQSLPEDLIPIIERQYLTLKRSKDSVHNLRAYQVILA